MVVERRYSAPHVTLMLRRIMILFIPFLVRSCQPIACFRYSHSSRYGGELMAHEG